MADNEDKEQKTEEATPRRREEAREKGQVAMSSEFMSAIGLCVGMAVLAVAGHKLATGVGALIVKSVSALPAGGTEQLSIPTSM